MLEVTAEKAHHILGKCCRDDKCGVVISCLDAFDGSFGVIGKYPSDSVVGLEGIDNGGSYVNLKSRDFCALIVGNEAVALNISG